MPLSALADLAQIIGTLGVIGSLLLVAVELRKNTSQSKLANYGDMVDRFMTVYSHTNDIELARLIAKGRKSYRNLSEDEKISFGHYVEQVCIALESLLQYDAAVVHRVGESSGLFAKHLRFHLGFPGAREWFDEFEVQRGFPAPFMKAVHGVLDGGRVER